MKSTDFEASSSRNGHFLSEKEKTSSESHLVEDETRSAHQLPWPQHKRTIQKMLPEIKIP